MAYSRFTHFGNLFLIIYEKRKQCFMILYLLRRYESLVCLRLETMLNAMFGQSGRMVNDAGGET